MVQTICDGPNYEGSFRHLELSNNIRSLIMKYFDFFVTSLAFEYDPKFA